ncbi:MAG: GH3 auxin-responsive promoter family protein [Opitutaceae bacterium]|jgi:hypothetical protein
MHAFRNIIRDARARVETDLLAIRLRRAGDGPSEQRKVLERLMEGFSRSDFGKAHKLSPGISYNQFREHVPPQSHATLAPLIDQVAEGVTGVLWPGMCRKFAITQALPNETPRLLPVTTSLDDHLRNAWRRSLMQLAARGAPVSTIRARQLWPGASSILQSLGETASGRVVGRFSDILVASLRNDYAIACLQEGQPAGPRGALAPNDAGREPSLIVLEDAGRLPPFLASHGQAFLSQPRRSVILIGTHSNMQTDELPRPMGGETMIHEVFACEAGIVAAQDGDAELGLRLFTDAGLFLEFIPLHDYDEARIADLGSRIVPLENVRTGMDYVMLVTSPAGLCRYATDELVCFVSIAPHRIRRLGHASRLLNTHGEKVNERHISECLSAICLSHKWNIVHFHVAPVVYSSLTGSVRGHHEWWVELKPGTRETPTGTTLAEKLDHALQAESPEYCQRRQSGALNAPVVRLVMPGVFEQWLSQNGLREDRFLIPPCLPDRPIANALAKLARFYD